MRSIPGMKQQVNGTVTDLPRPAVDPRFERMLDELAALVAREHRHVSDEEGRRRRAELAADGLVVLVTHLLAELDEARSDIKRIEEVSAEIAKLLAHEKAARERADQNAREAHAKLEAEAAWRRRIETAGRRERRQLLRDLP